MWMAWVRLPNGVRRSFEGGYLQTGWTTSGGWYVAQDSTHTDQSQCMRYVLNAPRVAHGASAWVEYKTTVTAGTLLSYLWVSSEKDYDGVVLQVDLDADGTFDITSTLVSGVPDVATDLDYPARYPEAVAVGAVSDQGCHASYSQSGDNLAFVAPSSGGPLNQTIETTDRSGANGYDPGDYSSAQSASGVGGTSASTALAAGIAGLMVSQNPTLPGTLAHIMKMTTNPGESIWLRPTRDMGYGRLNANGAVHASACDWISIGPAVLPDATKGTAYSATITATGGTPTHTFSVSFGALPPGLTLNTATGAISGTPTAEGMFTFAIRGWNSDLHCFGDRTYRVLVEPGENPSGTSLYVITPCRAIDTRKPAFAPALPHLGTRDVQIGGVCGVPATAKSVAAIITAVSPAAKGFLAFYPTGTTWAGTSTMNYRAGKTRANNAIVTLSASGQTTVLNNGATQHFIIDVTGYFQ
jgi:hypothetical protein